MHEHPGSPESLPSLQPPFRPMGRDTPFVRDTDDTPEITARPPEFVRPTTPSLTDLRRSSGEPNPAETPPATPEDTGERQAVAPQHLGETALIVSVSHADSEVAPAADSTPEATQSSPAQVLAEVTEDSREQLGRMAAMTAHADEANTKSGDHPTEYLQQLRLERLIGDRLADRVTDNADPQQRIATLAAIAEWLPTCDDGERIKRYAYGTASGYGVPSARLARALAHDLVTQPWAEDPAQQAAVLEQLRPLAHPNSPNGAQSRLADALRRSFSDVWPGVGVAAPDDAESAVRALAHLSDAGIVDEGIWGAMGIGRFSENTPIEVTRELVKRYVDESRDAYAPRNARAHLDTLGNYCTNVLRRVAGEADRNPINVAVVGRLLRLDSNSAGMRGAILPVVQLANRITEKANRQGGLYDETGIQRAHDTLPESYASTGEALRRILQITRKPDGTYDEQDALHAKLVHELSMVAARLNDATTQP